MKAGTGGFGVATLHSTHAVMRAEKILKEAGLEEVRLIPVPRQISSDCGVTVRFLLSDLERARELLGTLEEDLEGIHTRTGEGWETVYEAP